MRRLTDSLSTVFLIVVGLTLAVWLLRGFGILTFIPGGLIWLLILLSISTGIMSALQRAQ
ncbi:MAG: hypothetical protein VKJ46_03965 [Leptolyngbyaceae bacterium]|nr:hypothetical protein [Leptolyngbyaceae bacterium]